MKTKTYFSVQIKNGAPVISTQNQDELAKRYEASAARNGILETSFGEVVYAYVQCGTHDLYCTDKPIPVASKFTEMLYNTFFELSPNCDAATH